MSQIFDQLRRGRPQVVAPREYAPRGASGDAVLATLGYAPEGRRSKKWGGWLLALLILAVGGWTAWTLIASWPIQSTEQPQGRSAISPEPPVPAAPAAGSAGRAAPAVSPPITKVPATVPPAPEVPVTTAPAPATTSAIPAPAAPNQTPSPRAALDRARLPERTANAASRTVEHPSARSTPRAQSSPGDAAPAHSSAAAAPDPVDHASLAVYYHHGGDFENARVHYSALIQQNPLNAQAHNNLGLLYHQKGLFEDAARQFERALSLAPGYESAHLNYGATLLLQGKADAAAAHFREVLENDARNVDALVNLGLAQKASAQPEEARQSLLHALNIAPRHPAAHYNLAVLFDEGGEAARAIDHYRSFLTYAGPEHAPRTAGVKTRIQTLSSR